MPLLKGKKNIGKNIQELQKPSAHAPHGRSRQQAIAIALSEYRRQGGKTGGEYSKAYRKKKHGAVR